MLKITKSGIANDSPYTTTNYNILHITFMRKNLWTTDVSLCQAMTGIDTQSSSTGASTMTAKCRNDWKSFIFNDSWPFEATWVTMTFANLQKLSRVLIKTVQRHDGEWQQWTSHDPPPETSKYEHLLETEQRLSDLHWFHQCHWTALTCLVMSLVTDG